MNQIPVYKCRPDLFHSEITYLLEDDCLCWNDEKGNKDKIEYKNIYSVRLLFTPNRINKNQYSTEITETNGKLTKIKNIHFKGVANFEDRSQAYNNFLIEFHKNLYKTNTNARFISGINSGKYNFYWVILIFFMFVLFASLLFMISFGIVWIAIAHILAILYLIPLTKNFMKKNKPGKYDPANIPALLLPKT